MKKRIQFVQCEFYTNWEAPSDYIVIIETVDNKPIGSYTVKVPTPYTLFPRFPHVKN
jgi:hypothetical protein